ncbi:MAG TPA: Dyp-type peroxidase [Flavilitoribacter sp.]|nr:Dyp-type peroxidase [Flavilitoribacter sp.]HMQ86249.1 Dyp-type peroxidase [Flavilitoribacter sp.]
MGRIKAPRKNFKPKPRLGGPQSKSETGDPQEEIIYYYAADVEKLLNDPAVVEIKIVEGSIEDSLDPSSLLTSDDEKFLVGVTRKEGKKVKEEWAAELVVGVRNGKKKRINRPGARIKKLDNDDNKKDLLLSRTESHEKDKFEPVLKRIQANILWHHKKKFAVYSFLTFAQNKRSEATQWLSNLKLTSAYDQMNKENKVDTIRCAYLTYKGYEYLNIPSHLIPESGVSTFKAGPEERTVYTNRRQFKDKRYDTTTHMVLLEAFDDDSVSFEEKINEFKIAVSGFVDLSKSFFETAFTNFNGLKITQDWFGFQEGIGNPKFFSSKLDNSEKQFNGPIPGNAPLNIVLTEDPNGVDAGCYGSFLVFLKLQQEVQNFEALSQDLGAAIGKSTEEAAELLIGRKKNGEPLVPLKITDHNIKHDNYFDYSNDAEGKSCPFHAHIRKANPRKNGFEESNIVRRSMSYIETNKNELDQAIVVERKGMFFMAFMRNIEQQFERLVNYQMYDFDESDPNNAPDPLIVDENYIDRSYFNANGQKESFSKARKLVTYRGGIYLFAPSLPFFKNLD